MDSDSSIDQASDLTLDDTREGLHAMSEDDVAPNETGFYLLDDCGGRFVVDRAFGFISARDDELVELERGQIHGVRLLVIEPSGDRYELVLRLKLTGRVPQLVSDEPEAQQAPAPAAAPAIEAPMLGWTDYAPSRAAAPKPLGFEENAPFGSLRPEWLDVDADLTFSATPEPAPAHAQWAL